MKATGMSNDMSLRKKVGKGGEESGEAYGTEFSKGVKGMRG